MAEEGLGRPKPSPPFLEVLCKSSGKVRRFATGTEAGFALSLINRKRGFKLPPATYIEAVKEGEEPISFGPNSVLINYGDGWKLQTDAEEGLEKEKEKEKEMQPTYKQVPPIMVDFQFGDPFISLLSEESPKNYSNRALPLQEPGEVEPTTKRPQRTKNFSQDEDLLLVSGWINTSKDVTTGHEQHHGSFWGRIHSYVKENGGTERSQSSLMNRWSEINIKCGKFDACYKQIEGRQQSGQTEQDMFTETRKVYTSIMGKPFLYEHCWKILRDEQKWTDTIYFKKSKNRCNASPASSSPATADSINLEDESEPSTNVDWPLRRKVSKNAFKNKEGKENVQETTSVKSTD